MAILSCVRLAMVTLALFAVPFAFDDLEPAVMAGSIAGGVFMAWLTWRTYTRARDASMDRDFVPIDDRPPAEQRTIQNRALLVSAAGCAALSAMAWWEITSAAPGERITMWAPMAMMYDLAGEWGAILFPIGIWVALALFVAWKRRGMRAAEARQVA
ncbi:MAG TPA: hypothetical protein VHM30_11370 [Gemmatimonadaceae bacterium]|nr:hypothetical protein [Gemmatimonadaceae bacterium]